MPADSDVGGAQETDRVSAHRAAGYGRSASPASNLYRSIYSY